MSDGPETPGASRREAWNERHAARDPIEAHEPDPTIVAEVSAMAPGRALDVATGDGRNAVWLARRGWRVTAVDFSAVGLARARAAADAAEVRVDWVEADLVAWTPPPASFDLVAIAFLHLPAEERRPVYAAAAAAVRPGGTLLVVGHDRSNLEEGSGGPRDPGVLFTPDEIAGELAGLTVVRAEVVRRPGGGDRGPLDAVVRAVRDHA